MAEPKTTRRPAAPGASPGSRAKGGGNTGRWNRSQTNEQRRAAQRQAILEGAATAIGEHGFFGTTVAHVVRAAGVSRRTVFEHFSSTEELFVVLHEHVAELAELAARGAVAAGENATARISNAVAAYVELPRTNAAFARALFRQKAALGPEHEACRARVLDTMSQLLCDTVNAERTGEPLTPLEARIVVAAIETGALLLLDEPDHAEGLARMTTLVLDALRLPR